MSYDTSKTDYFNISELLSEEHNLIRQSMREFVLAEISPNIEEWCQNNHFEKSMVPKFELLKATATGRLYGFEAYKKAINYLAITYANSPEGKQAQNIESNILPKLASKDFVQETDSIPNNFKVVFQFIDPQPEAISSFKETLDEVLGNIRYYNLDASIDVYNPNTKFVVVHGLKTEQVAKTFNQLLTEEDQNKIKAPYFVVSSTNYQIIQIHKNLDAYLNIDNN